MCSSRSINEPNAYRIACDENETSFECETQTEVEIREENKRNGFFVVLLHISFGLFTIDEMKQWLRHRQPSTNRDYCLADFSHANERSHRLLYTIVSYVLTIIIMDNDELERTHD